MRISDWSSDVCSSDLMAVSRQAPLVVPPDFSLVPPAPGAARTGTDSTAEQTLQALFGGPSQRSATETQVLDEAKGATADAGIRSEVRSEEHTSELQSLMRISYAVFCLKKKNQKNKQSRP